MSFWITIIIRPRSKKARELAEAEGFIDIPELGVIANKEDDGPYDRECSFIIEEGRNALQVVKA